MRISDGVEMLQLETELANGPGVINPLLVWDEKDVLLFDAGLPGMGAIFRQAAINAGVPFERLDKILITHADMDHIGSLSQIVQEASTEVTVIAHKAEKPYIECDLPPIRLKQMEANVATMTGPMKEQMEALAKGLREKYRLFRATIDKCALDGEVLPFCGGIIAIHTPGHTYGHMSYYIKDIKLLISGDILQVENGSLVRCPDFTVLDKEANINSLKKLVGYEIETAVCYHGGLFRGDVSGRIKELAAI